MKGWGQWIVGWSVLVSTGGLAGDLYQIIQGRWYVLWPDGRKYPTSERVAESATGQRTNDTSCANPITTTPELKGDPVDLAT